jgi:hypothetical protein
VWGPHTAREVGAWTAEEIEIFIEVAKIPGKYNNLPDLFSRIVMEMAKPVSPQLYLAGSLSSPTM